MSEFVHSGGNMAAYIDKLGIAGARASNNVNLPLKIYIIESAHFNSVPKLSGQTNQEIELYEALGLAFQQGLIIHPSLSYNTDVTNLRVQATAKEVTAELDSGLITINVPANNKLQAINLVGTTAHLDSGTLKIRVNYTDDNGYNTSYANVAFPTISTWDLGLVQFLGEDDEISETFNMVELSVAETPRKIVRSESNQEQFNIEGLNNYSTWGLSIRLNY